VKNISEDVDIAIALRSCGDLEAAREILESHLHLHPDSTRAAAWLSIVLVELGYDRNELVVLNHGLIRCFSLDELISFGASSSDIHEVVSFITKISKYRPFQSNVPIHAGALTFDFDESIDELRAIERVIDAAWGGYFATKPIPQGHHLKNLQVALESRIWGVKLPCGAYISPHYHQRSLFSGVLHLSNCQGGELAFGRPFESARSNVQVCSRRIVPLFGQAVMFPSYFFHEVSPVTSISTRLSLAFDLVPQTTS